MIKIKHISKHYFTKKGAFLALDNVSLNVQTNTVHGIIGLSGAGKSTLIRTINKLEPYQAGTIEVLNYEDIKKLNKEPTRMLRRDIGMIFQSFNLLESKTVLENILFAVKNFRKITEKDRIYAQTLIDEVGLTGYDSVYPKTLSGGQKQRVSIARALMNKPKILLCDEPTSALDPVTTKQILALIKKIKDKNALTVVLVSHDMNVIAEICDEVTVMNNAKVVESGAVETVLLTPKDDITKALVATSRYQTEQGVNFDRTLPNIKRLIIPSYLINKPLMSDLYRHFNVNTNVLFANIVPNKKGVLITSFEGKALNDAYDYLSSKGVNIYDT